MAIVGEVFAQGVKTQIQQREKMLGAGGEASPLGVRSPDYIKVQNKTSWLRLASAVDIKVDETNTPSGRLNEYKERVEKIKQQFGVQGDSELAKKLVLTSGTQQYSGDTLTAKAGINTSGTLINDGAYGFGGSAFGYKPMPGLISATFDYLNNGALAKAEVKLKCSSVDQLELLEALYLRPGYTVLLEWGHTTYLDNNGVVQTYDGLTKAFQKFFNPGQSEGDTTNVAKIADLIRQEREYRDYNYDGFVGVVTNFNWSFNTDGSYDVTLKIITHGSVIESLKVNSTVTSTETSEENNSKTTVEKLAKKSGIAKKLKSLMNAFTNPANIGFESVPTAVDKSWWQSFVEVFAETETTVGPGTPSPDTSSKIKFLSADQVSLITGYVANTPQEVGRVELNLELEEENEYAKYYITLGRLLGMIEKNNLYYTSDGNPYIGIDYDYYVTIDGEQQYATPIVSYPGQYSADPLVCSIPVRHLINEVKSTSGKLVFDQQIKGSLLLVADTVYELQKGDPFLRNAMAIHVNFKTILESIENNINGEGKVDLIKFLQDLLQRISTALGGVNTLKTRFDEDTKKLQVYDEGSHILGRGTVKITPVKLKPYGVTGNGGSIVKNLAFQSELTNEFSTQIAIGAQANGNQVGENATSFSEFNIGLVDRITPIKLRQLDENAPNLFAQFTKNLIVAKNILVQLYDGFGTGKVTTDNIETLKSINSDYAKYILGYFTYVEKALPAPFFIPFNLQLDLEGISGIKLFQRFNLEDRILPYMYRGKVDFIIRNLKHEINNNTWTTKIETLTAPTGTDFNALKLPAVVDALGDVELVDASYNEADTKTITTGYPIKQFFYPQNNPKTQIYLHHTAGSSNILATLRTWDSKAASKIATHYIISPEQTEHVFKDEYWANHLGIPGSTFKALNITYRNLNITSLSIELTSYGALTKRGNKYYNAYGGEVAESKVGKPVDAQGREILNYKGFQYYEKYTDKQIAECEKVVKAWMDKFGINYTFNYSDLFPPAKLTSLSKNALRGVAGIYTHNSVRTDKSDVWPQKELVEMLKRLGTPASNTATYDALALRLNGYFKGYTGPQEERLAFEILQPLTLDGYKAVQDSYRKQFNLNLTAEIVNELPEEYLVQLRAAYLTKGFRVPGL